MESQIALDKRTDRVVHIADTPEGYSDCVCPDCGSAMIAANRNPDTRKNMRYFRLRSKTDCVSESLLHRWAIQILRESSQIMLPAYVHCIERADRYGRVIYGEAELPERLTATSLCERSLTLRGTGGPYITDLWLTTAKMGEISIEVHCTHPVDDRKAVFYRHNNIPCVEIDIPKDAPASSEGVFAEYVCLAAERRWIMCPVPTTVERDAEACWQQASDEAEREWQSRLAAASTDDDGTINRPANITLSLLTQDQAIIIKAIRDALQRYRDESLREDVALGFYRDVVRPGRRHHGLYNDIVAKYGKLPNWLNIDVPAALAFRAHPIIWQYHAVEILRSQPASVTATMTVHEQLDWVIARLAQKVPLSRIAQLAYRLSGSFTQMPSQYEYLFDAEDRRDMPLPAKAVSAYYRALVERGVIFRRSTYGPYST